MPGQVWRSLNAMLLAEVVPIDGPVEIGHLTLILIHRARDCKSCTPRDVFLKRRLQGDFSKCQVR